MALFILLIQLLEHLFIRVLVGFALLLAVIWVLVNFYIHSPYFDILARNAYRRVRGNLPDSSEETVQPEFFPTITILLPAYEEGGIIENAISSIRNADYPQSLINIKILIEPDDDSTRLALKLLEDRYEFETLTIPEEYPGEPNKPRALNYGWENTTAAIVGVIDAEDIVSKNLFKEAINALLEDGADFTLSRLDMVNEDDGWLNVLFRAEYGYWYRMVLPGFEAADFPIPLGGSTCFFKASVLEATVSRREDERGPIWSREQVEWLREYGFTGDCPWNPKNVTEDFELGLFLWEQGFDFELLDSVTSEESPTTFDGWLAQRTRWKKGKLFTFRHYLDDPPNSLRHRFHIYLQSLLPHLGPINIAGVLVIFWLGIMLGVSPGYLIGGLLSLGLVFVIIVLAFYTVGYWLASDKSRISRLRRSGTVLLSAYAYWILQWIADIRALIQLRYGRLDWAHTHHYGRNRTEFITEDLPDRLPEGYLRSLDTRFLVAGLIVILILATSLRAYRPELWSLWEDEIYTVALRANQPVIELLYFPQDPHPPLYFLIAHFWMEGIGSSATAMRGLSVMFSIGTVLMGFVLARELYDDLTGLVAALLVSLSTVHIHFGRTIRMYSLFTFLVLCSWYYYVRTDEPGYKTKLGYILFTVALLYTHVYAIFVVLAQNLQYLLSTRRHLTAKQWWGIQGGISILYLPWIVALASQLISIFSSDEASGIGWIPEPSASLFRDAILMYGNFPSFYPILGGGTVTWIGGLSLLFLFNFLVVFAVVTYRRNGEIEYYITHAGESGGLGLLFLSSTLVPFAISYFITPIFFPRYTIVASLALLILVSRGIVNLPHRRIAHGLLVLIVVTSLVGAHGYYTEDSVEDWRGVVNGFEDDTHEGDVLLLDPGWIQDNVEYYYDGATVQKSRISDRTSPADLREITASHDRIWLITLHGVNETVMSTLTRTHSKEYSTTDGVISVHRFAKKRNSSASISRIASPLSVHHHPSNIQLASGYESSRRKPRRSWRG